MSKIINVQINCKIEDNFNVINILKKSKENDYINVYGH